MILTSNYALKKPEGTDPVDVQDFNDNADKIDAELKKRLTTNGKASDTTVEFTAAAQLTELQSGESLKSLFGKLKLTVKKVIDMVSEMAELKKSVADGKKLLAGTISNVTATAADATFEVMNNNIASSFVAQYNRGVTDADARPNSSSTNYKSGYNAGYNVGYPAGVTAADARANPSSANYQSGYNAGAASKPTIHTGVATVWVSAGGANQNIPHPSASNFAIQAVKNGRMSVTYVGNYATYGIVFAEGAGMSEGYISVPWVAW